MESISVSASFTSSIRWSVVQRILLRELRDQLRDRRTLFMVVMLPILMFPLLGVGMLRLTPAFEREPRTVVVVGSEDLPEIPPLLSEDGTEFYDGLFDNENEVLAFHVIKALRTSSWNVVEEREKRIRDGSVAAVVLLPDDLSTYLRGEKTIRGEIQLIHNGSDERSLLVYTRLRSIFDRWNEQVTAYRLATDGKQFSYAATFRHEPVDIASSEEASGSVWSRLFPFLLVMMALTGAFYPSIDICAGERERGTLETLLISPAARAEIVVAKFLTVSLASLMTAFLNLASMAVTGWQVANAFQSLPGARSGASVLAAAPLEALLWMFALLIPMSLFFGALSVAVAGVARSMKEGQHWMTPLYLATVPLAMSAMSSSVELNLGLSLIPVLNLSVLLRELMQGDYDLARRYASLVMVSTLFYGMLALRVAILQFQREDVLFRDAEKLDLVARLRYWLKPRWDRLTLLRQNWHSLIPSKREFVREPAAAGDPQS